MTYFSFYDYWNNQTATTQDDAAIHSFTQASNTARMKFMLSIVLPPATNDVEHLTLPMAQAQAAADAFAGYLTKSNYLTTADGRPIVFLQDTRGVGSGSIADQNTFIGLLQQSIRTKTGQDGYLLNDSEYGLSTAQQLVGDGYSCLNIGSYVQSGSYSQYVAGLSGYFAGFDANKPTARCAMSGFNEAPRTGFWIPKASVRYFRDDAKSQFPAAMTATLNSMQAQPASPVTGLMTVYAWNEWHEGGIIEPNVRDGSYYLNSIQQTFNLIAH